MWEVISHLSQRGNSLRSLVSNAIAALIAVFLLAFLIPTSVFAAGNAVWSNDDLFYEGHTYVEKKADGSTPPGLAANDVYYSYRNVLASGEGQHHVIKFSSNNPSTIASANIARYQVFDLDTVGSYKATTPSTGPIDIVVRPKVLSASSTQAVWNNDGTLEFDGLTHRGPKVSDGTSAPQLPTGMTYYEARGSPGADGTGILRVIGFPSGVDTTTQATAQYYEFTIDTSGNIGAQSGNARQIAVVPLSETRQYESGSVADGQSSCGVEGIGWVVCPVSSFLAWGMDNIFDLLKGFMEVTPLSTDQNSSLYQAWNLIRTIANIAFVIAFLIIIYSQLTNFGIDNYGIKKLIPRLIVAALLVNLSYIICAIAVDLSNILGTGVDDMLTSIRHSVEGPNTNQVATWESVTSSMLAVGTGVAAGAITLGGVVIASGASLGAALILLLPMLLGLIIAILVALLVLAARQALIIILIILAPLAFVAYLLPNTEKLFDKWRSLFITMLVFFPLFALIFSGSQLAAFLLIQTASGDNAINIILLAMFVQVAPLVLTPLLVRFSGGIIGKIAGFVNDPKKGLIDRTRNFAKSQSEFMAARNMARQDPVRRHQVLRRFALTADRMKRAQEERLTTYKERSDARWTNSAQYSDIQQDLRYAQDMKTEGVESAGLRYDLSKTTGGHVQDLEVRNRYIKMQSENAKSLADLQWDQNNIGRVAEARLRSRVLKDQIAAVQSTHDAEYEEFKMGRVGRHLPRTPLVGTMLHQSRLDTELLAINAMRSDSAKRAVTERFTKELEDNIRQIDGQLLQTYAGGVQGIAGAQRALATAISAQTNASNEAVKNATTILSHGNFDDAIITNIALGNAGGTGIVITDDMRMAAITKIAGGPNATEIIRLMEGLDINTTAANQDFRQTFAETLGANSAKPKFAGAGILANMKQGFAPAAGPGRLYQFVVETINGDKLGGADVLVTQDKDYLAVVRDAIRDPSARSRMSPQALARLKAAIIHAKTDPQYRGRIADRRQVLDDIEALI